MKKLMLLFLIAVYCSAFAQDISIPVKFLSKSKSVNERYIGTDAFGGVYTIADNEFRKQKDGIVLKYKNLSFGEIFTADIQNPLQIVLFYKKFNSVVLLDNQLNEISRINFSRIPQPLIAEAASLASQNRLWIFDITTQQIGLFDPAQNSYKTITPPLKDIIKYYQSDYNYFCWIDATNKCFAVNLFGKVVSLGNIERYDQVQFVSQSQVLLKKDNSLYLFNIQNGNTKHIDLVEKSFRSFYYKEQILSIFTDQEINHYKVTLPE